MKIKQQIRKKLSPAERANIHLFFQDMYTKNMESEERQSEQRIKFFLTLTTSTIALIAIFQREGFFSNNLFWITLASLCILFSYGLLTFARIISRNRTIDQLNALKTVSGKLLVEIDPTISDYIKCHSEMEGEPKAFLYKIKGTFAQYMYVTEGLLAAGIIFTIGFHYKWWFWENAIMTIYSFFVIPIILFKWSQIIRKASSNSTDDKVAA